MQRATPSTLAETASIFCETLAFDGALESANPDERIALLDTTLQRNLQVVVDIHSRCLFTEMAKQTTPATTQRRRRSDASASFRPDRPPF